MTRYRFPLILMLLAMTIVAGGCLRGQPRETRPLVIIPDMEFQAKFKAQGETSLFEDGRTMRTPPAGTVARGTLKEDPGYFTGKVGEDFIVHNPRPITAELLGHGQKRFNIYCSPCHDRTGGGRGVVIERGFAPPTSYHEPRAREFVDGYIFNVITNGIRNMPSYGAQIPADDRWAIVAYVRALQRSQYATLDDVPPGARKELR